MTEKSKSFIKFPKTGETGMAIVPNAAFDRLAPRRESRATILPETWVTHTRGEIYFPKPRDLTLQNSAKLRASLTSAFEQSVKSMSI